MDMKKKQGLQLSISLSYYQFFGNKNNKQVVSIQNDENSEWVD